jgi:hypothetical protein
MTDPAEFLSIEWGRALPASAPCAVWFVSAAYIPRHILVSVTSRPCKFSLADATGTFLGILPLATWRT